MPPVLGPWSSSPTRLKSWAGASGTTVLPSQRQNSDTSGPSRNSSMTTTPPSLARHASRVGQRLGAVVGDDDALAGGQPVVLDDVRARPGRRGRRPPRRGWCTRGPSRSARRRPPSRPWRTTCCPRAARPARTDRRRRARRRARRRRPRATSGASGPITTRSTVCRRASSTIPAPSSTPPGRASQRAIGVHPGVAGGHDHRVDLLVGAEGLDDGVLAGTGTDHENLHGSSVESRRGAAGPARAVDHTGHECAASRGGRGDNLPGTPRSRRAVAWRGNLQPCTWVDAVD